MHLLESNIWILRDFPLNIFPGSPWNSCIYMPWYVVFILKGQQTLLLHKHVDRIWQILFICTCYTHYVNSSMRPDERGQQPNLASITNTWWRHQMETYWPFLRGIHPSPVDSPLKGQWHGALMFSLICACMNKQLSKQSTRRRFDMLSRSLWRRCNGRGCAHIPRLDWPGSAHLCRSWMVTPRDYF